jgi:AcrR family transcriptional regulator
MGDVARTDFQRARTPEQQEERRQVILATARTMLDEQTLQDISLRELARRVGLAKSNVVRYFPTREAVFLEVMAEDWDEWLDAVEAGLPRPNGRQSSTTTHQQLGLLIARTLAVRPRFAALIATHAGILEHNVTDDVARRFKKRALANTLRLADLLRSRMPGITAEESVEAAAATFALVAGAWPMTNPAKVAELILLEEAFAALRFEFEPSVARLLAVLMDGLEPG